MHTLFVSGVLHQYKHFDDKGILYRKVVSKDGSSYKTFMLNFGGPLAKRLADLPSGSPVGLYGCKLGPIFETKPFVPVGETEAVVELYERIIAVQDLVCPDLAKSKAEQVVTLDFADVSSFS